MMTYILEPLVIAHLWGMSFFSLLGRVRGCKICILGAGFWYVLGMACDCLLGASILRLAGDNFGTLLWYANYCDSPNLRTLSPYMHVLPWHAVQILAVSSYSPTNS